MGKMYSCRQCRFCHWKEQYCSVKDSDMGKNYMMAQKYCFHFQRKGIDDD